MNIMYRTVFGLVLWTFLFTVFSSVSADTKVVVIPLNRSSNIISMNSTQCTSSIAGTMRWTGAVYEGCNGTKWVLLSPIPTVYSSGHEWMDRNLGASGVATSSTDEEAYGDLYQWGRFADGHESRTSGMLGVRVNGIDPGHGFFVTTYIDWLATPNDNLWQGSGINNPCPPGFRLPTTMEWETERGSWESKQNATGAFSSPLKLTMAGYRDHFGTVNHEGTYGGYWSSTVNASYADLLFLQSNIADERYDDRAYGLSVRCIKN